MYVQPTGLFIALTAIARMVYRCQLSGVSEEKNVRDIARYPHPSLLSPTMIGPRFQSFDGGKETMVSFRGLQLEKQFVVDSRNKK